MAATAFGLLSASLAAAENIDPVNDDSQYAYAENVGWLNAEPNGDGGDGIQVNDLDLTGWIWAENIGWLSLSCINTNSCATVTYGVANDACGNLSGYAWAENAGWVNFSPSGGGVAIDPQTGEFSGSAWGENIGWVTFADDSPVAYGVVTSWRRQPPTALPQIDVSKDAGELVISWEAELDAEGYDVFLGSLADLLSTAGDFAVSTTACLAENQSSTEYRETLAPGIEFYLVRAANCGGSGTCDSGGDEQAESRDGGVASSGTCQ
jgi:hypothetical protein